MVKDDEDDCKIFAGVVKLNCLTGSGLRILFVALLVCCSILTVIQFFPFSLSFSVSTAAETSPVSAKSLVAVEKNAQRAAVLVQDEVLEGGKIIKRAFNPYGTVVYNFILMSAYRGGDNTFAIVGLASKSLSMYGKPTFLCEWVPHPNQQKQQQQPITTIIGHKYLPDNNFGHFYTVVVVNCTFPVPVGYDSSGGTLFLYASTNGGGDTNLNRTDTIEALTEAPGSLHQLQFMALPKYDYLYCGACLYGNLSPQRIREWLAYHVRLFGPRSHFVIHDAGGVHYEVMKVLRPWIDKGYVTLEDLTGQERFDGFYHNQVLVLNDCMHRYRFMAKWIFVFDVDEYIFVPKNTTLVSVMDSLSNYTQFTFEQIPMSYKLCRSDDEDTRNSKWGLEKLVYRDVKRRLFKDRKYAMQPRYCFATWVHRCEINVGMGTDETSGLIVYYHYHGSIAERNEPCQQMINTTDIEVDGIPYVVDTGMCEAAESVKRFELQMIGSVLQNTRH